MNESSGRQGSPTVAVVIPTRNRVDLVARAVRSVLEQSFSDFELIVVDDGSTDATVEKLSEIEDPRLRVLARRHSGVSMARNAALEVASSTWVAFLDDDNTWLPTYLERQLLTAHDPRRPGVVYCLSERRSADHVERFPTYSPSGSVFQELCGAWGPLISSVIVRRDMLVEEGGFSPALEVFEDRDLLLRLALRTPFLANDEVLVIRYEHERARLLDDQERRVRCYHLLHHRWRRDVRRRLGLRVYARWTRRWLVDAEVSRMFLRAESGGRRVALGSLRLLAPELPWSWNGVARALTMLVLGPRGYSRLRAAIRER